MNRRQIVCCVAMLLVGATAFVKGAGSDVADAVMKGDTAAVRKLLLAKADVNVAQVDGATALHWAVYRDDVQTADLLLKAGANVKAANREGTTPLFMAALYGNPAMIERLLKAGADAKSRGPNGETPLMFAARNGNPAAIKLLVAAGADVNAKEVIRATTALMWAAEEGHAPAAKALLELGADVSAKSGPAGLPRNYMAQAVNVEQVEAAAKRRREAREAGRSYEDQLAFEQANGLAPKDDVLAQAAQFVVSGAATAAEVAAFLNLTEDQVTAGCGAVGRSEFRAAARRRLGAVAPGGARAGKAVAAAREHRLHAVARPRQPPPPRQRRIRRRT